MKNETECPREAEVLEAVLAGRSLTGDIEAHVIRCLSCGDLAVVATAIRADAERATREASVPPSGAVWWRMQRRMGREAARRAWWTVTAVYTGTLAATAVVVLGVLGGVPQEWLVTVATTAPTMPLLLCAATAVLLAPFAVYYAVTE